jgi:succinate dehydrogenase / fumarate reductase flavoprotein subunit
MQGLADGYFVAPYTVGNHLASRSLKPVTTAHPNFDKTRQEAQGRVEQLLGVNGKRSVESFHRELGNIMWEYCGMARNAEGLKKAADEIRTLKDQFWKQVFVPGSGADFNQQLELAGRVADFMEFGELFAKDALAREESAGGHFREEHKSDDGEAKRDDENFQHVAAWEHAESGDSVRHQEELNFEVVTPSTRSYK